MDITATYSSPVPGRVAAFRRWMACQGMDVFVIPTSDPHDSEYLPDRWKAREWLTGFTGSAGLALLSCGEGWLWTDSRYFLQAGAELSHGCFRLMREGEAGVPSPAAWLRTLAERKRGSDPAATLVVGYVPEMMPEDLYGSFLAAAGQADGSIPLLEFRSGDVDPFDLLWQDRPACPSSPIVVQAADDAGEDVASRLARVRDCLSRLGHARWGCLLNDLSEIAWLLNIRGADVDFSPFVLSYLLLTPRRAVLYVAPGRADAPVTAHLGAAGVELRDYDAWRDLGGMDIATLLLPRGMNHAVVRESRGQVGVVHIESPVPALRAVKNAAEVAGFRRSMERDGVAMVRFLSRLDRTMDEARRTGTPAMTEHDVHEQLTALRAAMPRYCSLSFPTIAAYGPNGAIVHYEPEPATAAALQPRGLLLLDSGAHYEDGTTDLTRTIALGPLTDEERRVYTLVLRAHIALAMGTYPEGAVGLQIDAVGREHLWACGYDFGHGTGHGVGSRLGVHEGPHQIRKDVRPCTLVPFRAGMVVTDEPGIYLPGRFGVRLENVLLALPAEPTPHGRFFRFETLTLCPFDLRPVDASLLLPGHIDWLNSYHARVRERLLPHLDDEADRRWLEAATRPL